MRRTLQLELGGRVAAQLVIWVKSPLRTRESEKAAAPVLARVTVWVVAERPVTGTASGKVMDAGVTVRDGLTALPLTLGWGRVWPVTRTVRPWSRVRVEESSAEPEEEA